VNGTFTTETAIHLFEAHMSSPAFIVPLTDHGLNCFKAFFLLVNSVCDGKIVRGMGLGANEDFSVTEWNLQGASALWSIAFDAASDATAAAAMDFLTSLNQRLVPHLREHLPTFRLEDIRRCLHSIHGAVTSPDASSSVKVGGGGKGML
jgi:hypothetical protein